MDKELSPQQKAAATIRERYGDDYYSQMGIRSNAKPKIRPTSFANNKELASKAGKASAEKRRLLKEQESAQ